MNNPKYPSNKHTSSLFNKFYLALDAMYVSDEGLKFKNSLRYRDREALAYLVSQGPHTYASTKRVLNEVNSDNNCMGYAF